MPHCTVGTAAGIPISYGENKEAVTVLLYWEIACPKQALRSRPAPVHALHCSRRRWRAVPVCGGVWLIRRGWLVMRRHRVVIGVQLQASAARVGSDSQLSRSSPHRSANTYTAAGGGGGGGRDGWSLSALLEGADGAGFPPRQPLRSWSALCRCAVTEIHSLR